MEHKQTSLQSLSDKLVRLFFVSAFVSWGLAVLSFGYELLYWLKTQRWLLCGHLLSPLAGLCRHDLPVAPSPQRMA